MTETTEKTYGLEIMSAGTLEWKPLLRLPNRKELEIEHKRLRNFTLHRGARWRITKIEIMTKREVLLEL